MNKPAIPSRSLLEGKPYTPADKTDLRETWKRWREYFDGGGADYRQAEESEQAQYEEQQ